MSKIDSVTRVLAERANLSAVSPSASEQARQLIAARVARAEAVDPPVGWSMLIVPGVIALLALGWFVPALAALAVTAPLLGLALAAADRTRRPDPTDLWHGR